MGLLPLEFTECLQDSPYFRDSLISHEKELERTSNNMKELIKEVKNLLSAARTLSSAQRRLSNTLLNFKFECIGNQQTDDEIIIAGSLKEFGRLISAIEDEKERMLDQAQQFIIPLENFRKEHIGSVKEGKKKFDKQTAKFCASQERYLGLSRKKQDTVLQDADATLEMEQRDFIRAGLEYVCLIQEVQERKKFEFVETLLGFMYGWLTFYHHGHEVAKDYKPHMTELQTRIQKTRENFDASRADIHALMRKMLEVRQSRSVDIGTLHKGYTRAGYLYFMEKKSVLGTTTWSKSYCCYQRNDANGPNIFRMIPYNHHQTTAKIVSTETFRLKSCVRRISDSIDKRFCFDITPDDKPGVVYTFQALSEEDCELWLDAMDGKEPMYVHPPKPGNAHHTYLDEAGFTFIAKCFQALDNRGLEDQGLYRIVGVTSKVNRLLTHGLDKKKLEKLNFEDATEVESKTVTSAVKTFLRNLPEPIMTYKLHSKFIAAAKLDTYEARVAEVKRLTEQLPEPNKRMLEILSRHLERVAMNAKKNMMTVSNLGVCFGPTLLRNEEETVAAIMDIKFGNLVVEIFVENWRQILAGGPPRKEPRLSSAPVGLIPSQHQLQQQYQNHRNIHATLSNSSAPLMRGSSSSSISTSQDHLAPYNNSPSHSHSVMSRLNAQHQMLPQGAGPPPPIKQRSFIHQRANSGNDSSPSNQGSQAPNKSSGINTSTSPPYVNASAAEADLLNNSFGSDRGSNAGANSFGKQTKYQPPPRHAPKQPPPPAPIGHGGMQLVQPPYIPPPQPRGPPQNNNFRKLSRETIGASRPDQGPQYSHDYQPKGNDETSDLPGVHTNNPSSKRQENQNLQNVGGSDTSSSMESLTSGGGSSYGERRINHGHTGAHVKGNDGESSEISSSRERIGPHSRRRMSAESSPRDRKITLSTGNSDEDPKDTKYRHGGPPYGAKDNDATDPVQEQNQESDSDEERYANTVSHNQNRNSGRLQKDKSSHSSAVRTAMLEVESTVAASQDAYRTASAAYGSPINIPQTATVQPLQQLQQSQLAGIDKVMRTSASSPSPSSSASSSTANQFNVVAATISTSSNTAIMKGRDRVRTLYACVGEHESELSFEPNQLITAVRPSLEPGWLEGSLDGKIGLVPENYVEFIT